MASVYVHSGAAGAGTGADWANAYTTLAAALTAKAAGDDFWVAHDHAETQATAMTLTSPGTASSPCRIMCVNRSGAVPPGSADLATTATITTTGNNNFAVAGGHSYWYGVALNCGTGAVAAVLTLGNTTGSNHFRKCKLAKLGTTGVATAITFGFSGTAVLSSVVLDDTTLQLGATADSVNVRNCRFVWRNTSSAIAGAAFPTTLFGTSTTSGVVYLLEGVDLSALGSGKTLFPNMAAPIHAMLKDCKLGSSVTVAAAQSTGYGARIILVRCDSGDTNYRSEIYDYTGTQTTEITIVRTGGASDGTTPISSKLVTTANSKRYLPFEALPISIWNETTGSAVTLTVEGIWGGGAVPTNADIWMDVEYLGTSGFPLGSFASSGPADQLAAGTNLSAGSGTWGGSTTKFKLEKTVTPQEKGPITVYVKAALPSSIFFIDPKIAVS